MKFITYEDSLLEVNFTRIISTSEKYFVELKKDHVPVARFDLKHDKMNRWMVVEPAPFWVYNLVPELTRAIAS